MTAGTRRRSFRVRPRAAPSHPGRRVRRRDIVPASDPGEPSRAWGYGFRALYRGLGLLDPFVRSWWTRQGLGNVVEVTIAGRRSGRPRRALLGLLVADGQWYLGHPNGAAQWTRNLDAAGGHLRLTWPGQEPVSFEAQPLVAGPERDRAIEATGQHPFPGNLIYRLGRRHVRAAGRFYRLELDPAG